MSLIPEIKFLLGNIEINNSVFGHGIDTYIAQKDDINYSYMCLANACCNELIRKDIAINYLVNVDTPQSLYWLSVIYLTQGSLLDMTYYSMYRKKIETYQNIILQKSGTLDNIEEILFPLPERVSYKYELHLIKLYKLSCNLDEYKFAYDLCIKHKDDHANVLQNKFRQTYGPFLIYFVKDVADIILSYLF